MILSACIVLDKPIYVGNLLNYFFSMSLGAKHLQEIVSAIPGEEYEYLNFIRRHKLHPQYVHDAIDAIPDGYIKINRFYDWCDVMRLLDNIFVRQAVYFHQQTLKVNC